MLNKFTATIAVSLPFFLAIGPSVNAQAPAPIETQAVPAETKEVPADTKEVPEETGAEPAPSPTKYSEEAIQTLLNLVGADTELDEVTKKATTEAYTTALEKSKSIIKLRQSAENFRKLTAELQAPKDPIDQDQPTPAPEKFDPGVERSLSELKSIVQKKKAEVDEAKRTLEKIDNEINTSRQDLLDLPRLIKDANEQLAERPSPSADENAKLAEAKKLRFDVEREAAQAKSEELTAKQIWLTANLESLPRKRELALQELDRLTKELNALETAEKRKRENEVERDIERAEVFLQIAPESLLPLAEESLKTAKSRRETEADLQQITRKTAQVHERLTKLKAQYERAKKDASQRSSITRTVGELLRDQRDDLQEQEQDLMSSTELKRRADDARAQRFLLGEERAELDDLSPTLADRAKTIKAPQDERETSKGDAESEDLLAFRRRILDGLENDSQDLSEGLVKLESEQESLRSLVERYTRFIDERVLWIRSTQPFFLSQGVQSVRAARVLFKPSDWRTWMQTVIEGLRRRPVLPIIALGLLILMFSLGRKFRQRLRENGIAAESRTCRDFGPTFNAVLLTIGIAGVWPALFYLIGTWLHLAVAYSDARAPLAAGFIAAATLLLPLELWRQADRPKGLMLSHFSVPERVVRLTRPNLTLLVLFATPLVGFIACLANMGNTTSHESLGRVLFCLLMIVATIFNFRVFHPSRGIGLEYFARKRNGVLYRTRYIWFAIIVALPAALAVLSLLGYQFTAEQLANRLVWSGMILLGLWFLNAMAMRWILLSRRRLAIEQARARLAKTSEQSDAGPGSVEAQADLESIDLDSVDQQTRRLLRVMTVVTAVLAFWSLWFDILPALSSFNDTAWRADVVNAAAGADESAAAETPTTKSSLADQDVTYADIAIAILILVGMIFAMRDIPGLLELLLLQHLPLDVALRFAITTLTRYVILLVGIIWACNQIHLAWSQLQWLVAGVSVGLGFGLQEIFANFVSGLIVLFERPLRAGDIVTIDGVTGVVKSIRLRSTVIQDWDRKDLIVPNKDFITGRLLNWTLSNEVNRIVIPIGVAYGSDTEKAKALLKKVANDHPLITEQPAPIATFEQFGDSSLNLVLRCYISLQNMSSRLDVVDQLYTRIDLAFREADIVIPFPQRDLHLRSSDIGSLAEGRGTADIKNSLN